MGLDDLIPYEQPSEEERQLVAVEKKRQLLATARDADRQVDDRMLRNSAEAVRDVIYDLAPPLPGEGTYEERKDYYMRMASRIPAMDKTTMKQAVRSYADIQDCENIPMFSEIAATKLERKQLVQNFSISLTDNSERSTSGIGSLVIQKSSQDVRVSETNNTPPQSIFAGILGKRRK